MAPGSIKTLIVIAGPTASGKTALAIELAQKLDTEIISADSRQFYREMSIGTAKPSPEELARAKHHFIDSLSITDTFSVGDFEREGLTTLENIFKTHDAAIMVGGSGLFIKAICEGFDDLPITSPEIRQRLNKELEENGITYLQEKLKIADPAYYSQVDLSNPQRLIRALDVYESAGAPFSSFRKGAASSRYFRIVKIGIDLPREVLYKRINQRADNMIEQGLVEEVRSLLPYRYLNALNTVGYSEVFDYFDGKIDLETAVSLIKQNTRRYAKRQMTWFRKDKEVYWINPGDQDLIGNIMNLLQ
ncbi:MAG: tRNA (adenosine(37)-N6)-dimethylallyltransferase MiaA [Bacteroidetes bacterium]|nr:tRNA (adenosine(37)-N6)-dimethylallyltransferase MiaA [Bacteroidota bacterium]